MRRFFIGALLALLPSLAWADGIQPIGGISGGEGGSVSSVFGRTGAVTAQTGDYTVSQVTGAAASGANADITGLSDITGSIGGPTATSWNIDVGATVVCTVTSGIRLQCNNFSATGAGIGAPAANTFLWGATPTTPPVLAAPGEAANYINGTLGSVVAGFPDITFLPGSKNAVASFGMQLTSSALTMGSSMGLVVPSTGSETFGNLTASSAVCTNGTSQLTSCTSGTWTPAWQFATTQGTITYGANNGRYTQIGNQVTVEFDSSVTSIGTSAGAFTIGGLPVTSGALGSNGNITCGFYSGTLAITSIVAYIGTSSTSIVMQNAGATGSSALAATTNITNSSRFACSGTYHTGA